VLTAILVIPTSSGVAAAVLQISRPHLGICRITTTHHSRIRLQDLLRSYVPAAGAGSETPDQRMREVFFLGGTGQMAPTATAHVSDESALIQLEELDAGRMRDLVAERGTDVATRTLFDCVCDSVRHGTAIREIDRLCEPNGTDRSKFASPVQVVVIPGFLYREYPTSGADGRMLIEAAERLGWQVRVIEVASTGRLTENAHTILNWLKQHARHPTVLASISKGGSDVVAALQQRDAGEAFRHVVGWVDVCGIIRGSPVVDSISRKWLPMLGFRTLFALRRWCFASVLDMRYTGGVLEKGFTPPPHLRIVHVVGFPQAEDFVHRRLRSFHALMGSMGPSDGAILLHDSVNAPGVVYPVWGADHYMRPRHRTQPLCHGLLQYCSQPNALENIE
jgi:hypothetical protein